MRRHAVQSTRHVRNSITHDVGFPATRAPFICARCRIQSSQPPATIRPTTKRTLTTAPPTLQQQQQQQQQSSPTSPQRPPQRDPIVPQTHYDFFPITFPLGPPPASTFTPDLRALRKEYLSLQSQTHPDLAPAEKKRHAEALSMRLNEAYKTLQDPLRRAQYILSLQGIDVEDESAKLEEGDKELLMEVMEAREAVDEVEEEEGLVGLRAENDERIRGSVGVLERAFETEDWEVAAREAVRLRYWVNVEESIVGWEKGRGGGLVHH